MIRMFSMVAAVAAGLLVGNVRAALVDDSAAAKSVYDFTVKDIDGKDVSLASYKGKVLLIVNVASKCGLTEGSYAGMKDLYGKYKDKGLIVLAFPANNFGGQEPGDNPQIKEFCAAKGAEFPVMAKVSVKGEDQCPLYQYLTKHPDAKIAGDVQWNFQKYLVGRDGKVVAKFTPKVKPTDAEVVDAIEKALAQQ